jgi:hypothetical protein
LIVKRENDWSEGAQAGQCPEVEIPSVEVMEMEDARTLPDGVRDDG